jgi:hypothetical protein
VRRWLDGQRFVGINGGPQFKFDEELFADRDPKRAERAMKAMLEMGRIDVAALRRAADGAPAA